MNYNINNIYKPHKVKRKFRIEAEHQACLKEAQASRLAIANLKKEIASAPEANSFIIEETCTETTVENFIPHADRQNFVEIDYENLNNQVFLNPQPFTEDAGKSNIIQLTLPNNGQALTTDKIKNILGNDTNSNIEIMFKTSDGNYVALTDDVLQNLQKDGLQYQVMDEEGRVGELQELQVMNKENATKASENAISKEPCLINPNSFFNNSQIIFGNEPLDMTIDNPKVLVGNPAHNLSQKELDGLTFNSLDIKPAFMEPNARDQETNFINVSDYFNIRDQSNDDSINDSMETEDCKESIELVDDESPLLVSSDSSKNGDASPKKFSPDIFFADVSSIDDAVTSDHLNEVADKNTCSNGLDCL